LRLALRIEARIRYKHSKVIFFATEGGSKYALEAEIGRGGLGALGVGARLLRNKSGG